MLKRFAPKTAAAFAPMLHQKGWKPLWIKVKVRISAAFEE
jgi:hypothetical protein